MNCNQCGAKMLPYKFYMEYPEGNKQYYFVCVTCSNVKIGVKQ